jgi:CelD/BcsL family acetyltransferase involved in cellulose biosynthesis
MKVTTIPAKDLSTDLVAAWTDIQSADPSLDSPFFRPEFTQAVAAVRDDVEVAVLEDADRYVGFFPFQRSRANVGRPVGGRLSDFQGVVTRTGIGLDPAQLLRQCRLTGWYFDHLIASQTAFSPFHWTRDCSPYIDVSSGYDAYVANRRAAGALAVTQSLKKKRKSENQLGPVRFEARTADMQVLRTLVDWKSQQYSRSNITSPFSFPWTVALLERLLQIPDNAEFTGLMSALYLGDRLAAVHVGMQSGGVVHWWFPAFDPELSKYSPGSQMILEMVRAAATRGIERIDLGKGPELYKRSFMTGSIPLAEGAVDSRAMTRTVRQAWHHAHHWARASRLRRPALIPWRWIMRVRDHLQFR